MKQEGHELESRSALLQGKNGTGGGRARRLGGSKAKGLRIRRCLISLRVRRDGRGGRALWDAKLGCSLVRGTQVALRGAEGWENEETRRSGCRVPRTGLQRGGLTLRRTLWRSAVSAPAMSFSCSLIMRRSASRCWIRNCSGRVLPKLKAALARCTTSPILLMVPGDREHLGAGEEDGRIPHHQDLGAAEAASSLLLRRVSFVRRERSPRRAGETAFFCLLSSLAQLSGPPGP